MPIYNNFPKMENFPDWITINEAIRAAKIEANIELTESDIYRHALNNKIQLSIYFQSPIILRKIQRSGVKMKLKPVEDSLLKKICILDRKCFIEKRNLILSTEGEYIYPTNRVINTSLYGYEYVLIQRLLAMSLNLPLPIIGATDANYGITTTLDGDIFQIFEKTTNIKRLEHQLRLISDVYNKKPTEKIHLVDVPICSFYDHFPLHDLPSDACFVILHSELEKLIHLYTNIKSSHSSQTRISTPLSRLFWLACKHNETISPLLRKPYKLLSIFEEWASTDGITDHLSGDTLKTALERGSPPSVTASN